MVMAGSTVRFPPYPSPPERNDHVDTMEKRYTDIGNLIRQRVRPAYDAKINDLHNPIFVHV